MSNNFLPLPSGTLCCDEQPYQAALGSQRRVQVCVAQIKRMSAWKSRLCCWCFGLWFLKTVSCCVNTLVTNSEPPETSSLLLCVSNCGIGQYHQHRTSYLELSGLNPFKYGDKANSRPVENTLSCCHTHTYAMLGVCYLGPISLEPSAKLIPCHAGYSPHGSARQLWQICWGLVSNV